MDIIIPRLQLHMLALGRRTCVQKSFYAGATGFVGTAIRNSLVEQYTVRGLTRSAYKMKHPNPTDPVKWIHCDAYDLDSVTKALSGADILIYLIHSMVPSSRLTQASFQDLDLLIADNFAKAAKTGSHRSFMSVD